MKITISQEDAANWRITVTDGKVTLSALAGGPVNSGTLPFDELKKLGEELANEVNRISDEWSWE